MKIVFCGRVLLMYRITLRCRVFFCFRVLTRIPVFIHVFGPNTSIIQVCSCRSVTGFRTPHQRRGRRSGLSLRKFYGESRSAFFQNFMLLPSTQVLHWLEMKRTGGETNNSYRRFGPTNKREEPPPFSNNREKLLI